MRVTHNNVVFPKGEEAIAMMKTQRVSTIMVSGMLALTLGIYGCGTAASSVPSPESASTESTSTGGATETIESSETTATPSYLTNEEHRIFDEAVTNTEAEDLKPIAVLATQVVAGANYAFLCQSEVGSPAWHIAIVYRNTEGESSLSGVTNLDLNALQTSNESGEGLVGAWEVSSPAKATALPQEAAAAFSDAIANYEGVEFSPVAMLSSQAVSGVDYRILCVGTTISSRPVHGLYVLTVHQDANGISEVTSADQLDLGAYATMATTR